MADIKQVFAEEMRRVARKELRAAIAPLAEQVAMLKKQVAEQKKRIADLEKGAPEKVEAPAGAVAEKLTAAVDKRSVRINAAGIVRLRSKLGITQAELGRLLGVAMHTISVWEQGRRQPRARHKQALSALRSVGKRELKRMLAEAKEVVEETEE